MEGQKAAEKGVGDSRWHYVAWEKNSLSSFRWLGVLPLKSPPCCSCTLLSRAWGGHYNQMMLPVELILSGNGPGELNGWIRPVARAARELRGGDLRLTLVLT